tara:strand:+ start:8639 stop:9208 length:570 start_codon:yes stop_codon:yes gene_type:complete
MKVIQHTTDGVDGDIMNSSLESLRFRVIGIMSQIDSLAEINLQPLTEVPLATLRKNATRLHGVCRYNKGIDKRRTDLSPLDVREVALHPESLKNEWIRYAEFLMFHEFLHAIGFSGHNRVFRELESHWPDTGAKEMGIEFSKYLRQRNAKFAWKCPNCHWQTNRSLRAAGRYICRTCRVKLVDHVLTVD